MGTINPELIAFNRGLISPKALARTDVDRTRLSCERMSNYMPKTQGAMTIRPGKEYIGATASNNKGVQIEFVAGTDDVALVELTDALLRVWDGDSLITRASVSSTINVLTSASGWSDNSTGGGVVGHAGGGLTLDGTNVGGIATVTHNAAVAGGDQNVEHAVAIDVTRGPVLFRIGSTDGGDEYVGESILRTGRHSLAFTPTGANIYVTFSVDIDVDRIVATCTIESSGTMTVVAPWAAADLRKIRYEQSADVVYCACDGYVGYQIERRGTGNSWSVVKYRHDKGPFKTTRTAQLTLKAAATFGNTTLTASAPFWTSNHVGTLVRVFHLGQDGVFNFGLEEVWSDVVEVTGVGSTTERRFTVVTTGTWSANLWVQRSFDGPDTGFRNVGSAITTNTTTNTDDADDNVIVWYRVGVPTGGFTSGTIVATVTYGGGGKTGIARVTALTSTTVVQVEVLSRFSDTIVSENWQEGWWSGAQKNPTTVALHESRLWWMGGAQVWASVTDDYENFFDETVGDSGPINRAFGRGPVDKVFFALPLDRLIVGTTGSEISIKSSSTDEPLTPTNNSSKPVSSQGSKDIRALPLDTTGVFVQRSGKRVFLLTFDFNFGNYQSQELTLLVPDLLRAGVVSIAIQRQPDTRIICVMGNGKVCVLTYERQEEVLCWSTVETDGDIEEVAVLPGSTEDLVYFQVKRTINSSTVRHIEKWALETETQIKTVIYDSTSATVIDLSTLTADGSDPFENGIEVTVRDSDGAKVENLTVTAGAITLSLAATYAHITPSLCKLADAFKVISQASSATVTGLTHLVAESVVVWADGRDYSYDESGVQKTYTVNGSGEITLDDAVEEAMVGLPYTAKWLSTKLAYGARMGTALTQKKKVEKIAFILGDTHNNGIYFGRNFIDMDALPRTLTYKGYALTTSDGGDQTVFDQFDQKSVGFPGDWEEDSRICLKSLAPRPATVMGIVPTITTHEDT